MTENTIQLNVKLVLLEDHETAIRFMINGANLMEFYYKDEKSSRTSTGNFDDLFEYLEETLSLVESDVPFPYAIEGNDAFDLIRRAEEKAPADDAYIDFFEPVHEWSYSHSWRHARAGSFIPDVLFRKVDDDIEISWDNENIDADVRYTSLRGCVRVPCAMYKAVVLAAIEDYRKLWAQ